MKIPFLTVSSVCVKEFQVLFLSGPTRQVEALHLTTQAVPSLRMVIKGAHSVFHEDK